MLREIQQAPDGYEVRLSEPRRTTDQNRLMWALLSDLAEQVDWHGQHLTAEEWKDVLTASLKKQRAVPGIDGGFVILGARTSRMTKAEMSELCELIYAFGAQQGVEWTA
jgi:hypothetical protein